VGSLGIYGRFLRKPPVPWMWLAISAVPIYAATTLYCLGFGRFRGTAPPGDWWAYNIAGMEVRSNIAHEIAVSRARRVLQEGDPSRMRALLGSSSRDQNIQVPFDLVQRSSEGRDDDSPASDSESSL